MTRGNAGRSTRTESGKTTWDGQGVEAMKVFKNRDAGRGKPRGGALHNSAHTQITKVDNNKEQQR
jgi:hypothetical protein